MTNRFLISVAAAALITGTGIANAQSPGGAGREGGAGSTMQQGAPSSGGGAQSPQHREQSPSPGMKSDRMGGSHEKGTVGQAPDRSGSGATTKGREDKSGGMTQGREERQGREGREKGGTVGQSPDKSGTTTQGREEKGGATTQGREDRMNAPGRAQQNQGTMDGNRAGSQTTGMAPAAPPAEKRSQITTAIRSEKFEDVGANVNVNVAVGSRLPASIHFHPLPSRIVEIYPEWRGYQVVLIKGRYVIVRPETHEIVYIIEG
jgi:hypothetical protein